MTLPYGTPKSVFKPRRGYTGTIILILLVVTALSFFILGWHTTKPPKDTIQINIPIVPQELYPLNLEGWSFTLQFGESETYFAEKGFTRLQANTSYDLLKQIHDLQETS